MTTKTTAAMLALMASAALCAPALGAPASGAAAGPFDAAIGASKAAMMAEPQKAYDHARAAETLAVQGAAGADRDLRLATAEWLQGEALVRLKRPREALPVLDKALAVIEAAQPGAKLQGDVLKSHGRAEAATGRVQDALNSFQKAFAIYQKANEPRAEALTLQEIGSIYSDARDYPRELQYYAQSKEIFSQDPVLRLVADNNLGFAYKDMHQPAEAEAAFRRALEAATQMKSAYLQASIYSNIAFVEAQQGMSIQARKDVAKGLALAAKDGEAASEKPFLLGVLAKIAADDGDLQSAAELMDRVFAGADLDHTVMAYRDFHEIAARVYERTGAPEAALDHLKAFKRLDDEGRNLAASTNAALMTARFDFANQTTKIAQLKAGQLKRDVMLAQQKARFSAVLSAILLATGVIVTGVIGHAFLTMRRSRDRIRVVNGQLETANGALERALKAKTEFLATTSHEIRTPLNGILGMTQVMLADEAVKGSTRERLGIVQSAGETMKALVDDLLDLSKIETGHVTVVRAEVDLQRLLSDAGRMWADKAATKGLAFDLDLDRCPRQIVEDADRLRQILFNLMSNATKFTQEGRVSLSVDVAQTADGERLRITVADTGVGIAASQTDRIFESFTQADEGTTRQFEGTGLGLTICRHLTEALDGRIEVRSELGAGSAFTVDLPLVRAETPADEAQGEDVLSRLALLVIEDNPLAQGMLRAVLQDKVRRLDFAPSAEAAGALLAVQGFDRVLADGGCLTRAGGQDPIAAVAALRAQAPVTALWPSPDAETEARLRAAGADQVIAKPVPPAVLAERLREISVLNGVEGNRADAAPLARRG